MTGYTTKYGKPYTQQQKDEALRLAIIPDSNQKVMLRLKLLNLTEKQRRELTYALLEQHISKGSGCYTLLEILLMSCNAEALLEHVDLLCDLTMLNNQSKR